MAALTLATASMAAGPYSVRSSDDPSAMATATPLAVVSSSPFDGPSGLLSDGQDHYYIVTDAGGMALDIAVDKNPALDTVRISFDDENPLSAPVHAGLSTVVVAPSTIDADGVDQAVVTIIPRDADGVALGTGLDLQLGTTSLWPGRVTGAVDDLGNGAYVVRVVSAFPGSGTVQVTVEGITLTVTPSIVYEEVLEPGSLLEWAIQLLQDVTANGAEFDQLIAGMSGGQAADVDEALNHTLDALTLLLNPDPGGHDEAVDFHLKRAIDDLIRVLGLVDAETAGQVISLINSLLEAGRNVAMFYVLEAESDCGTTCADSGNQNLCKAEDALVLGDYSWQETPPDYMQAATKYGLVIWHANREAATCN